MHEKPDWQSLARQYGFHVVKASPTLAAVEASLDEIQELRKAHPEIEVTSQKKYHTLSA